MVEGDGGSVNNQMDPVQVPSWGRPLHDLGEAAGRIRVPHRDGVVEFDLSQLGYPFPLVGRADYRSGSSDV